MTDRDLVTALQAAILRADTTWINQPSHLRRRLEEELGPDARRHRAQIHQLIVAAEERIPIRLKRNGWSPGERDELGHLLVVTRGWTAEASQWAVTTWAAALGLTDERPVVPPPASTSRAARAPVVERTPAKAPEAVLPIPTELPSDDFSGATQMPSVRWDGATELPPASLVAPTELPGRSPPPGARPPQTPPSPTPPPPPPPSPPSQMASANAGKPLDPQKQAKAPKPVKVAKNGRSTQTTPSDKLPKAGKTGVAKKAKKFLDRPIDAAYLTKVGPTPALLLLALPIGLAAFVMPALSGVLLMLFMLIMVFGSALWPARILAIAGDDVWLLSKKAGFGMKPKALIAQGTRRDIVFAGGRPFPSVRFAGERLWFQFPITGVARRLPVGDPETQQ